MNLICVTLIKRTKQEQLFQALSYVQGGKLALPEKEFYSFSEIAARWGATLADVRYYAEHGLLEAQVWLNERFYHSYSKQNPVESKESIFIGAKSFCGYVSVDPDGVKQIFANSEDGTIRCPILPEALRVTRFERDRFEQKYNIILSTTEVMGSKSFSGRPSTMHRITLQMRKRFERGEMRSTLNDEARILYEWAKSNITDMQIPTIKTIIEGQRGVYRELTSMQHVKHV